MADNDKLMDVTEVANYLGLSKAQIYAWTSKNKIPHYKPGGNKVFFYKSEVDEFVKNGKVEQ